jgi:hypothetical protein
MKKFIIGFGVLALGATIFIFVSKDSAEVESEIPQGTVMKKDLSKAPVSAQAQKVMQKVDEAKKLNDDKQVDAQMDEWDKEFDKIEAAWQTKVQALFVNELGLEEAVYKDYLKMKEGLDQDKIRAFDSFHKEMEAKYGPSYSYNPTEQERQFEKDIRAKYDEVLMKKIGKNHFARYLEVRDRFNQDLMEKQDPDKGVILMDF